MKFANSSFVVGVLMLALSPVQGLLAQSSTETIQKTARFQNRNWAENTLKLYNINGNVTVEGYDRDAVRIAAIKKINTTRQNDLDHAKQELQLVVDEQNDLILIYIDAPFINVRKNEEGISYNMREWDIPYEFQFDITLQVPQNIILHASTINQGKVLVRNFRGQKIHTSNVNGGIQLEQVSGTTNIETVNGDITASYTENPAGNSSYKTINGTINVLYPDDFSADIHFKSLNGDLFTNFQNVRHLPATIESHNSMGKTVYHIGKFQLVRIGEGDGGPEISFDVLNGDVYIKQIQS